MAMAVGTAVHPDDRTASGRPRRIRTTAPRDRLAVARTEAMFPGLAVPAPAMATPALATEPEPCTADELTRAVSDGPGSCPRWAGPRPRAIAPALILALARAQTLTRTLALIRGVSVARMLALISAPALILAVVLPQALDQAPPPDLAPQITRRRHRTRRS